MSGQQMQPDLPIVARNPQTGESVRVDIGGALQAAMREAVAAAVAQSKDALLDNGRKALVKATSGEKVTVTHQGSQEIEDNFSVGPATKRTFLQGMAVDLGFAAMAVLATVTAGDFDITDVEQWTLLGAMVLKTCIQTGMSYVMRLKVE
jgi:hypothetical protein